MTRRKTGRPRIEDRHKTNEARKPWLKLGMSRRTWYRRQAEKTGADHAAFAGEERAARLANVRAYLAIRVERAAEAARQVAFDFIARHGK
jgi:hypothetical protein